MPSFGKSSVSAKSTVTVSVLFAIWDVVIFVFANSPFTMVTPGSGPVLSIGLNPLSVVKTVKNPVIPGLGFFMPLNTQVIGVPGEIMPPSPLLVSIT